MCVSTLRAPGKYLTAGHSLNPDPGGNPSPTSHSHFLMSTGSAHLSSESPLTLKVMKQMCSIFWNPYIYLLRVGHSSKEQRTCQAEGGITYAAKQLWPGCNTKVPCALFGFTTPFPEALVSRIPTF